MYSQETWRIKASWKGKGSQTETLVKARSATFIYKLLFSVIRSYQHLYSCMFAWNYPRLGVFVVTTRSRQYLWLKSSQASCLPQDWQSLVPKVRSLLGV